MIDILTLDPTNPDAVTQLVDTLRHHFTPDQCEQFLVDLYRWERSIPKEARPVLDAYTRMIRRGAFVPAIVAKYTKVMTPLQASPEWREIVRWQAVIASLPEPESAAA